MDSVLNKIYFPLLLTIPLLLSAQPPKDIEGWRDAKWGMTKDQVLQAFPGEAQQEPPIKTKRGLIDGDMTIKKFAVNDWQARARFEFHTGQLDRIVLEPTGASSVLSNEWYKAMLPLLIERYGQPTVRNEPHVANGSVTESAIWSFPSTTIELVTYGQLGTTRIEFKKGGSKNNPL